MEKFEEQLSSLPGQVKVGEVITLGWNYYEPRINILIALIDFDARKDLTDLLERVISDDPKVEMEAFYKKVIESWTVLGYVKEFQVIHEFKGSTVPLTVSDINPANWVRMQGGEQ